MLLNSLAIVPLSLIQANGEPKIIAVLNMIELPLYFIGLFVFLKIFGIVGAALAWVARIAVDTALLYALGLKRLPALKSDMTLILMLTLLASIFLLPNAIPSDTLTRIGILLSVISLYSYVTWQWLLRADERIWVQSLFGNLLRAANNS